jgi:hypothetical protein
MIPSSYGWEAFPTPGALTHTRIIGIFSPSAPQVPGVTPGSPLCPWCCGYPLWRGARRKDHFPLPFITLLLDEVGGHARYTFIDGYAVTTKSPLIFISLQDIHKMPFTTPWKTFVWVVMPFGLYNVPATFQNLVMYIFTDLLFKFMTVFVDGFSTLTTIYTVSEKL